jgi:hypothetical protein
MAVVAELAKILHHGRSLIRGAANLKALVACATTDPTRVSRTVLRKYRREDTLSGLNLQAIAGSCAVGPA